MAKMYGKGKTAIESEEQSRLRWQVELEFVQCLANPNYLNFLAQRGYFKDQAFINYLKYLQYWKQPEYAKYLMYPMCLYFLDLLQYEHFRREIVNSQCCKFIDEQAILQWQHYTRKRTKLFDSVHKNNNNNNNNSTMQNMQGQQQQTNTQNQNEQQRQHQQENAAPVGMQNGIGGGANSTNSHQQPQQLNGIGSVTVSNSGSHVAGGVSGNVVHTVK